MHPQNKQMLHLPAIQDVDEFVSSSEQIWRNASLHLQWMGAVRMRVQTADKSITIIVIQNNPVHQRMTWEVKN